MHGLKPAPKSPYNNAHWPGPGARRLPSITLRGRLPHTRTSNHPLAPWAWCASGPIFTAGVS